MGLMSALDIADAVAGERISRRHALEWHLTSNHFPPIPVEVAPVAERVIEKANRGQFDARVRLPDGVTYKGSKLAPVWACVDAWHLDAFLASDDDA